MSIISTDSNQLALLMTLIAISFSEDRDPNEVNILGNIIITIGSIMVTIAAQKLAQELDQKDNLDKHQLPQNIQQQLEQLQAQIDQLKKQITP